MKLKLKFIYILLISPLLAGMLPAAATGSGEGSGKPPSKSVLPPFRQQDPPTDSMLNEQGRQISLALEEYCGKLKKIGPEPDSFVNANRAAESISALIGTWDPVQNPDNFKSGYRQSVTAFGMLPLPAGHPMLLRLGSVQQTATEYEKNYSLAAAMLAASAYLCQDTAKALSFVKTADGYAAVLPLNERDRIRLWDAGMRAGLAISDVQAVKQFAYRLFSEAAEAPAGDEVVMSRVWLADSLLQNTTIKGGFERSAFLTLGNYRYTWLHAAQALHRHGFYRKACAQARLAAESMRDDFDEFYCNKAYSLMAASAAMIQDKELADDVITQILTYKPGMHDAGDFLSLSKLYHIVGDEESSQKYYKKYQGCKL